MVYYKLIINCISFKVKKKEPESGSFVIREYVSLDLLNDDGEIIVALIVVLNAEGVGAGFEIGHGDHSVNDVTASSDLTAIGALDLAHRLILALGVTDGVEIVKISDRNAVAVLNKGGFGSIQFNVLEYDEAV